MGYYKLKNITNTLGKRDMNLNTVQNITFKDIIGVNNIALNPGSEIIIEATYLPVSAQKLRADGLITVVEIDKNAYQKLLNAQDARLNEKNAAALVRPAVETESKPKEVEPKKLPIREKSK